MTPPQITNSLTTLMTDFNQNNDSTSLKSFFESKTLTELGVYGRTLTVSVNYEACQFEKTGMLDFARKIPLLKEQTPFRSPTLDMDIDLSCVVLDESHQVLDKVWYGNVRSADENIRYIGSLTGADNFEETLMPQELITIKLNELPSTVQRLIFVISSHHKHPLCQTKRGITKISDDGSIIHAYELATISASEHGVVAWILERDGDDFRLSVPQKTLGGSFNTDALADELDKLANGF